jgi:hypothetical protein
MLSLDGVTDSVAVTDGEIAVVFGMRGEADSALVVGEEVN